MKIGYFSRSADKYLKENLLKTAKFIQFCVVYFCAEENAYLTESLKSLAFFVRHID